MPSSQSGATSPTRAATPSIRISCPPRFHETALRVALGASRSQLARELLSDSAIISVAGGISGMLLAAWTSDLVPALFYERDAERLKFAPDLLSIAEASFVCVGITILCGSASGPDNSA